MIDPNLGNVSTRPHIGDPQPPDGYFQPAWRPARLRAIIENEIERLIAFLDHVDGDADIEANGDEGDY
jgi:hypothetical protein